MVISTNTIVLSFAELLIQSTSIGAIVLLYAKYATFLNINKEEKISEQAGKLCQHTLFHIGRIIATLFFYLLQFVVAILMKVGVSYT